MSKLVLPVDNYSTEEFLKFGDKIRRRLILWAIHLGDDVAASAGTSIKAVGDGEVVLSEMRLGTLEHRNWGGVIVLKHENVQSTNISNASPPDWQGQTKLKTQTSKTYQTFYSIYGHLNNLQVKLGDEVQQGQELGQVAGGNTPENGMWQHPHLHFAIYSGPFKGEILPGYYRPDARFTRKPVTKLKYWHDPRKFIKNAYSHK